ncbi:MAG: aspartate aminotransferase family protein [Epulopiscium sp.]|nr:aspartate aminotransferase family protein [Candidatus Epulonipiscium sp.]
MENWIERGKKVRMNTYSSFPIVVEKGEGVYLWDLNGKRYLDFGAGIAVNALGYKHTTYAEALSSQLHNLCHCSNLYWNQPAIEAAEYLVKNTCFDQVFFCNSGAEAIEGALKLSRKYGKKKKGARCYRIISMKQSFHGRTLGALTATGQEKYQKDFIPLLPGVDHVVFNDIEAIKQAISEETCAILLEPIQGEGGIWPVDPDYLQTLRKLCTEKNILLVLDEVQTGIGRTGKLFAHEWYEIEPDIIATAKGLGGGIPIGAVLAKQEIANCFTPGDHASTFGGNPLACTAAKVVLQELLEKGLLAQVEEKGEYLNQQLCRLQKKHTVIKDMRGIGLMKGLEFHIPVQEIIQKCMDKGLLLVGAGTHIIRFVPPLVISKEEMDEGISILDEVLSEV